MTHDTHALAAQEHRTTQQAIHELVTRAKELQDAQWSLLAEVEQVATLLGPLSSQRLRAWVATRREQLGQEAAS